MKKIKLEVLIADDEVASETLAVLQNIIINNICEYNLSMEEAGLIPVGPTFGENCSLSSGPTLGEIENA